MDERVGFHVEGFPDDQFLRVPFDWLDYHMARYTGSEVLVLLYILRRTIGWKKLSDQISLRQFTEGIHRIDGTVRDTGTGLSRATVIRVLAVFEQRGILTRKKGTYTDGSRAPSMFTLHWNRVVGEWQKVVSDTDEGSYQIETG